MTRILPLKLFLLTLSACGSEPVTLADMLISAGSSTAASGSR
jgi:hypothetical protein